MSPAIKTSILCSIYNPDMLNFSSANNLKHCPPIAGSIHKSLKDSWQMLSGSHHVFLLLQGHTYQFNSLLVCTNSGCYVQFLYGYISSNICKHVYSIMLCFHGYKVCYKPKDDIYLDIRDQAPVHPLGGADVSHPIISIPVEMVGGLQMWFTQYFLIFPLFIVVFTHHRGVDLRHLNCEYVFYSDAPCFVPEGQDTVWNWEGKFWERPGKFCVLWFDTSIFFVPNILLMSSHYSLCVILILHEILENLTHCQCQTICSRQLFCWSPLWHLGFYKDWPRSSTCGMASLTSVLFITLYL